MSAKIKQALCLIGVVFLVMVFCVGNAETVTGDLESRLNAGRIEYDGVSYRPKKRLTTILVMGIDRWDEEQEESSLGRNGGQADFQLLVVFDENAKTVSSIHINRDMMAEMTVFNLLGEVTGTTTAQICLAYGYGDGAENSCEAAVECLSQRLYGIPIDHYLSMRLDGISALNDCLGGVEVTLTDDFTAYDPEMAVGTTIRLTGKQAEYYVRYRYGVGDGSNAARLLRQQNYMENAEEVLKAKLEESSSFVDTLFDAIDPYVTTDMNRGKLVNLAGLAQKYSVQPIAELEGENIVGESGLYEFYPDEDALMRLILEIFYDPIS